MSANIAQITDATFDTEVMNSDVPVLVDFWATWCGPCKMIAPILDQLADEMAGKLKICKIDVDSNREIAAKYNVRGVPTLMLFKGGNLEASKVGALSKPQLTQFIEEHS